MATVAAVDVKKLRDATGAGMMDAKKALTEAQGDFDHAVEILRVTGQAKVAKRGAERSASNGLVATEGGVLIQLGAETDFVAKNEQFQQLAANIVAHAAAGGAKDVEALLAEKLADGNVVQDEINVLAGTLGEKLELRRYARFEGTVATYMHRRASDLPPQIGVLVALDSPGEEADAVAKDVAMHVAALSPTVLTREEVADEVVHAERRIAEETAREEGKPEQALPRIIEGRVNGYFKENVLLEQAFAKDPKRNVAQVLEQAGVKVTGFARFRVGS